MPSASGKSPWFVEPLGKQHDRAAFACGNETLDRYLKEIASQDARRLVAAPFVAVASTAPKNILGYYMLSAFGIDLGSLPAEVARKLPTYPVVPATLLGRLAVDQRCRGQGIGEFLLIDIDHIQERLSGKQEQFAQRRSVDTRCENCRAAIK